MDYGLAKLPGRYGTVKPPMTGSGRGTLMPPKKAKTNDCLNHIQKFNP
jgi:hypothetical protein